jgi:hypothetical protein
MNLAPIGLALILLSPQEKRPEPRPEDVRSIDAIVAAVYDVISGPKGEQRDWDRFRSLFVAEARLIPVVVGGDGSATVRVLGVEDYIRVADRAMTSDGFFERELSRKVDRFGNLAQVFSTYESRRDEGDAEPFARGINSIQLLFDGEGWRVVTIFWDAERPDAPIPDAYLPTAAGPSPGRP